VSGSSVLNIYFYFLQKPFRKRHGDPVQLRLPRCSVCYIFYIHRFYPFHRFRPHWTLNFEKSFLGPTPHVLIAICMPNFGPIRVQRFAVRVDRPVGQSGYCFIYVYGWRLGSLDLGVEWSSNLRSSVRVFLRHWFHRDVPVLIGLSRPFRPSRLPRECVSVVEAPNGENVTEDTRPRPARIENGSLSRSRSRRAGRRNNNGKKPKRLRSEQRDCITRLAWYEVYNPLAAGSRSGYIRAIRL